MGNNVQNVLFLVYIMFRDLRERILDLRLSEKLKTKPLLKRLTDEEKALVLLCYICSDVSSSVITIKSLLLSPNKFCAHVFKCVCLNSCCDLFPLIITFINNNLD